MRSKNAKPLSISDQQRFDNLADLGCIACILDNKLEPFKINAGYRPQIHHMDGWVKPDCHKKTVPLCYWHHNGICPPELPISNKTALYCFGPSYDKHRPAFRERYGSDSELIEIVNKYLEPSC